MNTVVILQPSYIPWLGYFDQINKSDNFVFFNDVQYTRRDWRNRNKIKTLDDQEKYLTIPVNNKGNFFALIKDIQINYQDNWIASHLGIISDNYRKTPYFQEFYPILQKFFSQKFTYLSELNIEMIKTISDYLGIKHVKFHLSSNLNISPYKDPTEHLIKICQNLNASAYLTGDSAQSYLDHEQFKKTNINLLFHGYKHPEYKQQGNNFLSHLSIIDLIFNHGPESLKILSA
ncbi:hypothetical protein A2483_03625 [Candidatus Peregrinibacteria bacterium RIFOXYC2_FULL_33_13]|nr:MAG: hypothetical protein UR27_C0011G0024 [Candidatus Peregrinibacteria bacterium GW2011_GWA2_33_10]KKP38886.1 MAG: hypothetical protein UR30_C0014G0024 [Candidatus Peregrinibacteria bacterium GW2011_GWC2_33_13]OGJ46710.1 MAG: hypothetical protein A2229_02760 [Candidatus Peregrinibacteria bacterium RIFOXYA2_FULL_33_7]OGJ52880.1 MAG: hypothetical protein A2483_03625 [Candidatus Peregrinibacteria bacterium RIFOXYC2_FULL_33_13]